MKYITGIIIILCLQHNVYAQKIEIDPYYIGDRVPDLPLENILNYKDSVATLSSFGDKIIILDFWNIHCGSCISMFPLEDSLQKIMKDKIRFVMVTPDSPERTKRFLNRWDSLHGERFSIPVVTGDRVLNKLFRYRYIPHFVWIAPDGRVLAQTSHAFIDQMVVSQVLRSDSAYKADLIQNHYTKDAFTYPPLTKKMLELIYQLKINNNN